MEMTTSTTTVTISHQSSLLQSIFAQVKIDNSFANHHRIPNDVISG